MDTKDPMAGASGSNASKPAKKIRRGKGKNHAGEKRHLPRLGDRKYKNVHWLVLKRP
jgi:hypothetical protein